MILLNSLEERLYHLVISRLNGDDIHSASYRRTQKDLVKKGIGGFIVFGGVKEEVRDFIQEFQSLAAPPLFIASDIERGVGQQLRGGTSVPCPMALAAALDPERPADVRLLEEMLEGVAAEALDNGINMPLVPVMDVNQDPENPIICTRAFSDDPRTVSWFGTKYISVLERAGLFSCAKHFPGHGDTAVDSHRALPFIRKSKEELRAVDLVPFISAIKAGVSSIMVGHLAVPCLDDIPASLSKTIMHNLLREELGFDGLIITDALDMRALGDMADVPVKCINAGADIVLHPADADATVHQLQAAVASGRLTEKTINRALKRIKKAKQRLGTLMPTLHFPRKCNVGINVPNLVNLVDRSITLVKGRAVVLPVSDQDAVRLIFAGDTQYAASSPLAKYFKNHSMLDDIDINRKEDGSVLTFAIFTSVAAWRGSSGIPSKDREKIAALIRRAKKSIVISFGSPYVLRSFEEAGILIAAYEPTQQAQESVLKCLKGGLEFMGKLPVKIR